MFKIILGTAHMESTPGKHSPDGKFKEYLYSREICKRVYDSLKEKGYDVTIDIEDSKWAGTQNQELITRVAKVNQIYNLNKNCIYVSIHVNAAGADGKWHNATGWCAYTSKGITKADKLAECLYDEAERLLTPLNKKIRKDLSDGDRDWEANFYVLRNTKCPAVLTENFFQDNMEDVEWLSSEEGKDIIANIHVNGIINYIKKGDSK